MTVPKTVTIKSPVEDFNGRVGPVSFADGEGKLDIEKYPHLTDWFERKGYGVGGSKKAEGGGSQARAEGGPNDDPNEKPFSERSTKELREIAQRRDIQGASRMSKANLVKALEGSQDPSVEGSAALAAAVEDTLGTPDTTRKTAARKPRKSTARKSTSRKTSRRR